MKRNSKCRHSTKGKKISIEAIVNTRQIVDLAKAQQDDEDYSPEDEQFPPECQVLRDGHDSTPVGEDEISAFDDFNDVETSHDDIDLECGKLIHLRTYLNDCNEGCGDLFFCQGGAFGERLRQDYVTNKCD